MTTSQRSRVRARAAPRRMVSKSGSPADGEGSSRSTPFSAQQRQQLLGALRVAAGDDQGALAEVFGAGANLFQDARAKADARGGGEFKVHGWSFHAQNAGGLPGAPDVELRAVARSSGP